MCWKNLSKNIGVNEMPLETQFYNKILKKKSLWVDTYILKHESVL